MLRIVGEEPAIAVEIVKWRPGEPPSFSGFGFSFPSIAGA